jgi:NAD-dependent dihydropyrimidine dehydrogenase PreA subunit
MTYVIAEPCADVLDRACVEECPVDCVKANADFVDELGSPGGAAKIGGTSHDPAFVRALLRAAERG